MPSENTYLFFLRDKRYGCIQIAFLKLSTLRKQSMVSVNLSTPKKWAGIMYGMKMFWIITLICFFWACMYQAKSHPGSFSGDNCDHDKNSVGANHDHHGGHSQDDHQTCPHSLLALSAHFTKTVKMKDVRRNFALTALSSPQCSRNRDLSAVSCFYSKHTPSSVPVYLSVQTLLL